MRLPARPMSTGGARCRIIAQLLDHGRELLDLRDAVAETRRRAPSVRASRTSRGRPIALGARPTRDVDCAARRSSRLMTLLQQSAEPYPAELVSLRTLQL